MTDAEIHEGLPFDRYCALPGESASGLRNFLVSPLYYHWWREHPQPETDAMRTGRATHAAVLEPHRFKSEYAVWDGGVRRGKDWDAFRIENESFGRTIITEDQRDKAIAISQAVRAHPIAGALLAEQGKAELSITWRHPRTGLACKARPDWLGSSLIDLKTTKDVEPRLFSSQSARLLYHVQLAFYVNALAAVGVEVPVKLIVVQNVEPFDVAVYDVPSEVIIIGEQLFEGALDRLQSCRATGVWPGIAHDQELTLRLPTWALPDDVDWEVSVSEVA